MREKWITKKIGDVCIVERGGSPRPIDKYITDSPDGINWIKIGDTNDSMYITSTAQKIIPEGMKKSRYVKPGDFLLSNSMSFGRPYILKIDGCIHDGWLLLRDEHKLFDKRFLYYYLSAPSTYEKFKQLAVGGVVNNLNSELVRNVDIPIPNKVQQTEIADLLDKISNLIAMRKKQLQKLDDLVKSRFVEMFSGECENRIPLKDCCIDVRGGSTPSMQHPEYYGGNVPFIKSGDVRRDTVMTGALWLTEQALTDTPAKYVPQGSILVVNRSAALLREFRAAIALQPVVINQDIKAFIPKPSYSSEYLLWAIKIQTQYLLTRVTTVLTSHIDLKDLLELPIAPVSVERQQQFCAFTTRINTVKMTIQQSLDKLELTKKALMQKYFG